MLRVAMQIMGRILDFLFRVASIARRPRWQLRHFIAITNLNRIVHTHTSHVTDYCLSEFDYQNDLQAANDIFLTKTHFPSLCLQCKEAAKQLEPSLASESTLKSDVKISSAFTAATSSPTRTVPLWDSFSGKIRNLLQRVQTYNM